MKQIAYLGWLGAGNLGDEACYQLFRRCVHSISTQVVCVPLTIREIQGKLYSVQPGGGHRFRTQWKPADYDYVVLGGGSLLNADRYVEALRVAQREGVPTAIWGTGFDGIPHGWAAAPQKRQSAGPRPHPVTPDVFQDARVKGVRGPVTAAWLEAHGCEEVPVSGDPGLLFEPPVHKPPPPRDQVTVIWGASHRATYEGPSDTELAQTVARWLRPLARRWRLVIGTMWAHDVPAAEGLARELGGVAEFRREPLSLKSFGQLMSRTAWTLSYRLHGCILSAACGVPFCSVAYRSKCYDFAFSIDAGDWVVDPGDPALEACLDAWLQGLLRGDPGVARSGRARVLQHQTSPVKIVKTILRELDEGQ